jgi:hypothetical protein
MKPFRLRRRPASVDSVAGIHIHEDDWGMRNLYPIAALDHAHIDIGLAIETGERNRVEGGLGWTDMHRIQPPASDYVSAGPEVSKVDAVLAGVLPRVKRFTATAGAGFGGEHDPYGSYETDAYCYGIDRWCFIKVDTTDGNLVTAIWFEFRSPDPAKLELLRSGLLAIDLLMPSVIADYWVDATGAVADQQFLGAYLDHLLSVAA